MHGTTQAGVTCKNKIFDSHACMRTCTVVLESAGISTFEFVLISPSGSESNGVPFMSERNDDFEINGRNKYRDLNGTIHRQVHCSFFEVTIQSMLHERLVYMNSTFRRFLSFESLRYLRFLDALCLLLSTLCLLLSLDSLRLLLQLGELET